MAKQYATPGVYIEEKGAFSNSVVSVATAVPAFVGYTGKAAAGKRDLTNTPMRITSMVEFVSFFGGAPTTTFSLEADGDNYSLDADEATNYNLFRSLQLFFANGGGACYIVSVGGYGKGVNAAQLIGAATGGGITALLKEQEPTLLVVPDAVLLDRISKIGKKVVEQNIPLLILLRGNLWEESLWAKKTIYKSRIKKLALAKNERLIDFCLKKSSIILPISKYLENEVEKRYPEKNIELFERVFSWY